MTCTARRDGSDWLLNGHKRWNTNCPIADIVITWVRTDEGIRGFIVPTDAKGLERRAVTGKYSLRAAAATEFEMHDVRLPADAVLPGVSGLAGPLACLSEARYGIIWGMLGVMRSCIETALAHSTTRVQFGKPIGAFQLTQAKLTEMLLRYSQAQLLAHQIGRLKQRGELTTEQVSMGKLATSTPRSRSRARLADPRRQRHHEHVPGHAAHGQPRIDPYLRRHRRSPHPDHRPGPDRPLRFR